MRLLVSKEIRPGVLGLTFRLRREIGVLRLHDDLHGSRVNLLHFFF